jgi:hypothetical protein
MQPVICQRNIFEVEKGILTKCGLAIGYRDIHVMLKEVLVNS